MKILISNPNRIDACTRLIHQQAQHVLVSDAEVLTIQPKWGPVELATVLDAQICAVGVLDAIRSVEDDYDAVVLAGFAEPGTEAVRQLVHCPVVDITEAGPMTAMLLGRSYGVVTSTHAAVPMVQDRLQQLGLAARCAQIAGTGLGVPELMADRTAAATAIHDASLKLIEQNHCDTIVLGCAGMAGLADELSSRLPVPIIDPLRSAIALADHLRELPVVASTSSAEVYRWPF